MTTQLPRGVVAAISEPSEPRLQLRTSAREHEILDGAWWPRSRDPLAELPGLILAVAGRYGKIRQIMLNNAFWQRRFRRLAVGADVVRFGWFATLDPGLLIMFTDRGERVDLLIVPPTTSDAAARQAMAVAAAPANMVRAPDILKAKPAQPGAVDAAQDPADPVAVWDNEGGPTGLNGHAPTDMPATVSIR